MLQGLKLSLVNSQAGFKLGPDSREKSTHHSLGLCGVRMKMSLPKKKFFLGRPHFSVGPIKDKIMAPRVTILP